MGTTSSKPQVSVATPSEESNSKPTHTAGVVRDVRRVDVLRSLRVFTSHRRVGEITLCDDVDGGWSYVMSDRRIVRVTGGLVHSDTVGKVLSFLPVSRVPSEFASLSLSTPTVVLSIPAPHCYGIAVDDDATVAVITCFMDAKVLMYSLPEWTLTQTVTGFSCPFRVCYHSMSETFLIADCSNSKVVELSKTGEIVRRLDVHRPWAIACYDNLIVASDDSASIRGIDYDSGSELWRAASTDGGSRVESIRFGADGDMLHTVDLGGKLFMMDLRTQPLAQSLVILPSSIPSGVLGDGDMDLEIAANGDLIVVSPGSKSVTVYRRDTFEVLHRFPTDGVALSSTLCLPIASCCLPTMVCFLDSGGETRLYVFQQ